MMLSCGCRQCTCGVLFPAGLWNRAALAVHYSTGEHRRSYEIEICGPCFIGLCNGCDRTRQSQTWRCKCDHERKVGSGDSQRIEEIHHDWADWLIRNKPSGAINDHVA